MALIKCSECGKEISDKAAACPNCGMPLRKEERGTYDIVITRENQWFLVNPKIKIIVDSADEYYLENNGKITIPMTTGPHTLLFCLSVRKTRTEIDVTENMNITVKFNRLSGEIEVDGYKTESKTNTPNISFGIGGGFFKGGN